jgi:hypothetical protein
MGQTNKRNVAALAAAPSQLVPRRPCTHVQVTPATLALEQQQPLWHDVVCLVVLRQPRLQSRWLPACACARSRSAPTWTESSSGHGQNQEVYFSDSAFCWAPRRGGAFSSSQLFPTSSAREVLELDHLFLGANTTQHPYPCSIDLDSRSCCSVTVVIRTNLRDGFISPSQLFALNVSLQLQLP